MSRETKVTEVPFSDAGNLLSYPGYGPVVWRANEPFAATLRLITWKRGRSSVLFIWEDEDGHRFPMFVSDAFEVFSGTVVDGTVTGRWVVRKTGQNYGLHHAP